MINWEQYPDVDGLVVYIGPSTANPQLYLLVRKGCDVSVFKWRTGMTILKPNYFNQIKVIFGKIIRKIRHFN